METKIEADLKQINNLLKALINAQSKFISDTDPRIFCETMLKDLILITQSESGFIGEVLYNDKGDPYLKTHAITNIAWDEKTRNKGQ